MIGNRISWGSQGYTILEQGEINRITLELDVSSWLVCRPDGSEEGSYPTLALAQKAVEQHEP
ncbi:MAG: hypothetical protein KAG82_03710 [Alcanivoracaceae bacterium]|jgi:hypothetical protein|nr:hypothetical protein [Alcanivoracaceae bacterium]